MTTPALSDRPRRILATLMREYIETGEPVASAALTRRSGLTRLVGHDSQRPVAARGDGLRVAAAYVRRPCADRPRLSLLRRHAARGSPPRRATSPASRRDSARRPGHLPLIDELLSSVSHVLSESSRHVGFAIGPANAQAMFQRIEFVPIGGARILVVLVTSGKQVSQKTVDIGESVDVSELVQAANYLNSEFAGRTLAEVRDGVVERLREERTLYDQLLGLALRLATTSLESLDEPTAVFIDGTSTLLEAVINASGLPTSTLRALMLMVEEKQRLVRLLNEYIDGPGLTVVIGNEHSEPEFRPFSLIASTYFDGHSTGHGRRDRSDADALLARHQHGGRRGAGRSARAARPELTAPATHAGGTRFPSPGDGLHAAGAPLTRNS